MPIVGQKNPSEKIGILKEVIPDVLQIPENDEANLSLN